MAQLASTHQRDRGELRRCRPPERIDDNRCIPAHDPKVEVLQEGDIGVEQRE